MGSRASGAVCDRGAAVSAQTPKWVFRAAPMADELFYVWEEGCTACIWSGSDEGDEARGRLIAAAPDGLTAAKDALSWIWDPDADPLDTFERIADEFYRDTGFLRPGKSEPFGYERDEKEREAAWEQWRRDRSRKVRAALAAFVAKAEGRGA